MRSRDLSLVERNDNKGRKRNHIGGVLLCFIQGLALGSPAWADTEIDTDKALVTMEASERRVQALRWTVEFREGKVKDPLRLETAEWGPVHHHGHVVMEHFSGRYRVELDSVMRWVLGVNDHVAEQNIWSFDGVFFRDLNYTSPGKVLPRIPPEAGDDRGRGAFIEPVRRRASSRPIEWPAGSARCPPTTSGSRCRD